MDNSSLAAPQRLTFAQVASPEKRKPITMKKLTKPNLATCQFVDEDFPPTIMSSFHAMPSIHEIPLHTKPLSVFAEEDSV